MANKRIDENKRNAVIALYECDKTQDEIAEILDISQSSVSKILKECNEYNNEKKLQHPFIKAK